MIEGYIPKDQRKNILFLADDCRLPSGIGTMTREIIVGNAHRFNFIQIGAAVNHPEAGKIIDLSADINNQVGIDDSHVLIYPYNGYGDPDITRMLIDKHNIDAIVHFTDPRYWIWLYRMSAELRQRVPIFYYHIWDDLPAPHYNKPYYQSCDLLMGISKQSNNIAKLVLGEGNYVELGSDAQSNLPKVCYIPHGVNEAIFHPISQQDKDAMKTRLFGSEDVEFVVFHNNRNIRRKMTSDLILAFSVMYEKVKSIDIVKADKMRLLLHTDAIDENGTNLVQVLRDVCPNIEHLVRITNTKVSPQELNAMYNVADVVVNIASNEGWGLSSTEAMMTGRVLVNNVTGGLQDQCRFEDDNGDWIEFNQDFGSNHGGKYKKHGKWVKPVFPASINLQGSVPTPYIFDDRCNIKDIAWAILEWYNTPKQEREACGALGRAWAMSDEAKFTAKNMCKSVGDAMTTVIDNWSPQPRFELISVHEEIANNKNKKTGISI